MRYVSYYMHKDKASSNELIIVYKFFPKDKNSFKEGKEKNKFDHRSSMSSMEEVNVESKEKLNFYFKFLYEIDHESKILMFKKRIFINSIYSQDIDFVVSLNPRDDEISLDQFNEIYNLKIKEKKNVIKPEIKNIITEKNQQQRGDQKHNSNIAAQNKDSDDSLKKKKRRIRLDKSQFKKNILEGKIISVKGDVFVHFQINELFSVISDLGGKIQYHEDKDTNMIVCGKEINQNYYKVTYDNISILSEDEFIQYLLN